MPKNKYLLLISLFLILTTMLAYWQVGNHEFVNFDDNVYVTENSHIQDGITIQSLRWAFTTSHSANWHPLTWISHMLDVQLFGLKPQWHHLMNLLFHIANVLLIFLVLHRMTKTLWQSAFVAALFALHPLHVESVAWVAERKDVLSTFFWMLTLLAYSHYAQKPRLKNYLAVVAFFVFGLMAKPMVVTLPFVLLLLDYWPLGRLSESKPAQPIRAQASGTASARRKKGKAGGKQTPKITVEMEKPAKPVFKWALIRPLVLEKIPLFALTALSCAATYIAQSKGGAVTALQIITLDARVANAFVSYLVYIFKMIWPDNLAVFYPHPGLLPSWQVLGAALILVAATIAVFMRAKESPYLPVGWLWFAGTLVPVIGIVQVGAQAMADRYTYIPSIGLFLMAAWGIPEIFRKRRYGKEVLAASSALCLICFLILTWIQTGYWYDSMTLSNHALNVTRDNYYMYHNRGHALERLGKYTQAIENYTRAVNINPRYAEAFNNRGASYGYLGDHVKAIEDYDRAIQINPEHANAYFNRGVDYAELGNHTRAVQDFERAIQIDPEYADAYYFRGMVHASMGNEDRAVEDWKKAARLGSKDAGRLLNSLGSD
jgi:protein O-mannosyl-transferase